MGLKITKFMIMWEQGAREVRLKGWWLRVVIRDVSYLVKPWLVLFLTYGSL